jgi:hypothetical protein
MRLSHNIQNFEKDYRINFNHANMGYCISPSNLRKHDMNSLYKISYGLFALALVSGLLTYLVATFLFFTVAVMVLAMAVAIDDTDK